MLNIVYQPQRQPSGPACALTSHPPKGPAQVGLLRRLSVGLSVPNRIIRDSALASKKLASVSAEAERLFWRLLMVADDFGRFDSDPTVMLSKCFPRQIHDIKDKQVSRWYKELLEAGTFTDYTVNGDSIGQFVVWNQRCRAEKSKFPPSSDGQMTVIRPSSAHVDEDVDVDEDRRRRRAERKTSAQEMPEGFEEFWSAYPRKEKKLDAMKAWRDVEGARPETSVLLEKIRQHSGSRQWNDPRGNFIPLPATWLRGQRWQDILDGRVDFERLPEP